MADKKKEAEIVSGKAEKEYLCRKSRIHRQKMMILKLPGSGDIKMRGEDERIPGERRDKNKQIIWYKEVSPSELCESEVPASGGQDKSQEADEQKISIWTIAGPQGKCSKELVIAVSIAVPIAVPIESPIITSLVVAGQQRCTPKGMFDTGPNNIENNVIKGIEKIGSESLIGLNFMIWKRQ